MPRRAREAAFGHSFDGLVSLVVGTHTHTPTADHQILPGGTAYQTDAGMCGDYDSVIGMQKGGAALRFWRKMPGEKLAPAEGEATLCGVFVETDDATGLAMRVEPLRLAAAVAGDAGGMKEVGRTYPPDLGYLANAARVPRTSSRIVGSSIVGGTT